MVWDFAMASKKVRMLKGDVIAVDKNTFLEINFKMWKLRLCARA